MRSEPSPDPAGFTVERGAAAVRRGRKQVPGRGDADREGGSPGCTLGAAGPAQLGTALRGWPASSSEPGVLCRAQGCIGTSSLVQLVIIIICKCCYCSFYRKVRKSAWCTE